MGFAYMQYEISGHAFDRFNERTGLIPQLLPEWLSDATLFEVNKKTPYHHRKFAERVEKKGQYILRTRHVAFVIDPTSQDKPVVVTCVTLA